MSSQSLDFDERLRELELKTMDLDFSMMEKLNKSVK